MIARCLPVGIMCVLLLCCVDVAALAQNTKVDGSAYDVLWERVAKLVSNREYGAAREVLEQDAMLPALAEFRELIAEDDRDIHLLERLREDVVRRFAALKPGDPVPVGGTTCSFVRFDSGVRGDRLVLKLAKSEREQEQALDQLPAKSWVAIIEDELPAGAEGKFMIGIFYAIDKSGDRQQARKLLSAAAGNGNGRTNRWLDRLDRLESKNRKHVDKNAEERQEQESRKRIEVVRRREEVIKAKVDELQRELEKLDREMGPMRAKADGKKHSVARRELDIARDKKRDLIRRIEEQKDLLSKIRKQSDQLVGQAQ